MKTKNLLKKAFLLLALIGGASSASAADEVIFSLTNVDVASNVNVASKATYNIVNGTDATIVGGSASVYNGKGSATDMLTTSKQVTISGSGASYFHVSLSGGKTIDVGDVIAFGSNSGTGYIAKTSTKPGSTITITSDGYTVPLGSELVGQTEVYFWKPGSGEVKAFTEFTITRPAPSTDPAISVSPTSVSIKAVESGVEVTQNVTVTGSNLTGSTLTATLSPAVTGLSVTLGSNTITDGAISTTATLHYTQTENASGSTTLTLSDGTTSENVGVNYRALVAPSELEAISSTGITEFDLSKVGTEGLGTVTPDDYVVLIDAGSEVSFAENLAVKGVGSLNVTWRNDAVQAGSFKFKTTVPGTVTLKFSDTGGTAGGSRAPRYANVNGTRSDVSSNGSSGGGAQVTCSPIAVSAGEVIIKGEQYNSEGDNYTDNQIRVFTITFTPTVSKTITSAGWATLYSDKALDFSSSIANLTKAYIVTGATGSTLNLEEITGTIPANTGILLEGEGAVNIPVVASSSTDVSANKLVGVTSDTPMKQNTIYVLMNEGGNVGFYKNGNETDFTVGANTAYLPANFAILARSAYFFGGNITAVDNVEAAAEAKAKEGKFIENGKLVIVKNGQKFNAAGAKLY